MAKPVLKQYNHIIHGGYGAIHLKRCHRCGKGFAFMDWYVHYQKTAAPTHFYHMQCYVDAHGEPFFTEEDKKNAWAERQMDWPKKPYL